MKDGVFTQIPDKLKIDSDLLHKVKMEIAWKPLMTEAEAMDYTRYSCYAGQIFYHGTSSTAALAITTKGAKLASSVVNSYGDGMYFAFDKNIAKEYANQCFRPAILTAKVRAQNPKKFADNMDFERFLGANNLPFDDSQSRELTKLLLRQGFDAVEVGGDKILVVIFNKQQIAVFKSEIVNNG